MCWISSIFGDIAFITEDMGSKVQLWGFKNKSLSLIHEFKNADAAQSEDVSMMMKIKHYSYQRNKIEVFSGHIKLTMI